MTSRPGGSFRDFRGKGEGRCLLTAVVGDLLADGRAGVSNGRDVSDGALLLGGDQGREADDGRDDSLSEHLGSLCTISFAGGGRTWAKKRAAQSELLNKTLFEQGSDRTTMVVSRASSDLGLFGSFKHFELLSLRGSVHTCCLITNERTHNSVSES